MFVWILCLLVATIWVISNIGAFKGMVFLADITDPATGFDLPKKAKNVQIQFDKLRKLSVVVYVIGAILGAMFFLPYVNIMFFFKLTDNDKGE